jgi:transforming growth factor-beta-induced protein
MRYWIRAFASLAVTGLLAACGGGGGEAPAAATGSGSLAQALETSGSTNTMASAVTTAGLTGLLSSDRKYTLLMPTDEAMQPYGDELAELAKPENRAALQDYVKAHVVDGEVLADTIRQAAAQAPAAAKSAALAAGNGTATVRNLLGDELEITVTDGVVTVNGARFARTNLVARNGFLHIFGAPLFRPSVFGVVRALPQTATLEAAIRAAGLEHTLRGPGPFTLFAPTNDAFAKLLTELHLTAAQLLANKPLLTEVLTYHVLATRVLARQIEDGATPTTVQGQSITLDVGRDAFNRPTVAVVDARDRRANVTFTNLRARNGVVHLVDRVFLPTDKNIVAVAAGNPQFSILVEAVTAAGLVDTLSGTGPFTVFAPTNDAFVSLLGELGLSKAALLANKPLLTQVLTYHVLASRSLAASLTDALASATVEGQPIKFKRTAQGLAIIDARGRTANVVIANVQATNGVVHAIDKVILPTDRNLVQLAQSLPQFSVLVEAVVAAGLGDTLSGPGPFTVFAPTNDAFVALLGELGLSKAQLLGNTALLTQVLTYHVVSGQVLSSGIPFGQPVATVQGQTLTIGRDLKITDQRGRQAGIVATDVAATNGVVHVIDKVILPK